MLKNWTVITEATKDVMAREHYLLNKNHRNHANTDAIVNIYGSAKQSLNILRNCERYKLRQATRRKGGRPPTGAVEFCFTLPKGVRPTRNQWRQILNMLMVDLASHLNISTGQLPTIVRAVLHQQDQDLGAKGSGDHMHVLVGKFTDDLHYLPELQRKSTTRLLKVAFNHAVQEVFGISHQSYTLQKNYGGIAKKRAPNWKVKAARKKEEIQSQERKIKRMINQAKKWLIAFDANDKKQMNRQYNRLIKEIEPLEVEVVNPKEKSLYEFMQGLVMQVEVKGQMEGQLSRRVSRNSP